MTFLTIVNGKIEIHADIGDIDAPPAFTTNRAYEAARYLYDHAIFDWQNSSSMDFADEEGWPTKNACDDVVAELTKLTRRNTR